MGNTTNYANIDAPYDENLSRVDTSALNTAGSVDLAAEYSSGENVGSSAGLSTVNSADQVASGTVSGNNFDNIWLSSWLKSRNYSPKTRGFLLDGTNGYIECMKLFVGNGGIVGGSLDIPDIGSTNSFHVDSNGNTWWGANINSGYSLAPAYVLNNGTAKFTKGLIGGWVIKSDKLLTTDSSDDSTISLLANDQKIRIGKNTENHISIEGVNKTIRSSNFSPGISGFSIEPEYAEFGDVKVRGSIKSAIMEYQQISATAGSRMVWKSGGKLLTTFSSLEAPSTFTISITDPDSGHYQLFEVGDILRIKEGLNDNWFTVSSINDETDHFEYVCELSYGDPTTFAAGASVIDYGQSGQGGIMEVADDNYSPRYQIVTHDGSPWSSMSVNTVLGNLNGYLGYTGNSYGIGIGNSSSFLKYDTVNGLEVKGSIKGLSGYFGGEDNGISIKDTGLELTGNGFIRTSDTYPRLEIIKGQYGDYSNYLRLIDSSNQNLFVLGNNGSPSLQLWYGGARFSDYNSFGGNFVPTVEIINQNSGTNEAALKISKSDNYTIPITDWQIGQKSSIFIDQKQTYTPAIYVYSNNGGGDQVVLRGNYTSGYPYPKNYLRLVPNSYTANRTARITTKGQIDFPEYYLCTEFDERGNNLSEMDEANNRWDFTSTNNGSNERVASNYGSTSLNLKTHEYSANSTATLKFFKTVPNMHYIRPRLQFRVRFSSWSASNATAMMGWWNSSNYYLYLFIDKSLDSTYGNNSVFLKYYNNYGVSPVIVKIGTYSTGWFSTYIIDYDVHDSKIRIYEIEQSDASYDLNDYQVLKYELSSGAAVPYGMSAYPYFSVDNGAGSGNVQLEIDYIKLWYARYRYE